MEPTSNGRVTSNSLDILGADPSVTVLLWKVKSRINFYQLHFNVDIKLSKEFGNIEFMDTVHVLEDNHKYIIHLPVGMAATTIL